MPMIVDRKWVCDVPGCRHEEKAAAELLGVAYHFLKWLDLPHGWSYVPGVGSYGLVCPKHTVGIDQEPKPDPETVKQAMEDVKAGKSRTAKEILDEIRDRD